jgi:hypothetical protein
MAPDQSSLPPLTTPSSRRSRRSSTTSESPVNGTGTPPAHLSPSVTSLAAAAAVNAGIQSEDRRPSTGSLFGGPAYGRRRSSVRHNIALNDPAMPSPGELAMSPGARAHAQQPGFAGQTGSGSPTRHVRAPSLGELHQELESEQEAQVVSRSVDFPANVADAAQNRLLSMIRQQEVQIQLLQSQVPQGTSAIDDSNPPSNANSRSQTPAMTGVLPIRTAGAASMQRQTSTSRRTSHSLSTTGEDHHAAPTSAASLHLPSPVVGGFRDESAFYQAETQNLTRENQMLKHRIRELERRLAGVAEGSHVPSLHSTLSAESRLDVGSSGDGEAAQ